MIETKTVLRPDIYFFLIPLINLLISAGAWKWTPIWRNISVAFWNLLISWKSQHYFNKPQDQFHFLTAVCTVEIVNASPRAAFTLLRGTSSSMWAGWKTQRRALSKFKHTSLTHPNLSYTRCKQKRLWRFLESDYVVQSKMKLKTQSSVVLFLATSAHAAVWTPSTTECF